MTVMQEQAIEMIKNMSDDKIYYVVSILRGIEGLSAAKEEADLTKAQRAYENIQHFRRMGLCDRDYKKELREAMEEKDGLVERPGSIS